MRGSRLASLTLAWYGMLCCLPCTCSFPVSLTRALTGVLHLLIHLPTQPRSALAKGVGGGPHFQVDQGLLLEITREERERA